MSGTVWESFFFRWAKLIKVWPMKLVMWWWRRSGVRYWKHNQWHREAAPITAWKWCFVNSFPLMECVFETKKKEREGSCVGDSKKASARSTNDRLLFEAIAKRLLNVLRGPELSKKWAELADRIASSKLNDSESTPVGMLRDLNLNTLARILKSCQYFFFSSLLFAWKCWAHASRQRVRGRRINGFPVIDTYTEAALVIKIEALNSDW